MATAVKEVDSLVGEYAVVSINSIEVDEGFNNRRTLGDLEELAESIKSVGLLEPLIVWRKPGSVYHLIAGERRLAASKLAGLTAVPIVIRDLDEAGRLEALIVENLQRKDIDPLEEAAGYKRLLEFDLSQKEVAAKVGRSEAHISKRLALIGLSATASKLLAAGTIPLDAAVALAKQPAVYQDRAIERLKKNYRDINDLAPYHLKRLGEDARDEAKKDARAKKRAELKKKLKDEGVTLLSTKDWYSWGQPGHPWELGKPIKKEDIYGRNRRRVDMTPKQHSEFPCHAAAVTSPGSIYDTAEPKVVYLCTDPTSHMTKDEAAKFKQKIKDSQRDPYAEQQRRVKAVRDELRQTHEQRIPGLREALRTTDQQSLATLALESFVMSANLEAVATILGLPAGRAAVGKSIADYCNASHANLVRAAAAAAIHIGQDAIARIAENQAGGYGFARDETPQAIAVADWFQRAHIDLTETERKALDKAKKK